MKKESGLCSVCDKKSCLIREYCPACYYRLLRSDRISILPIKKSSKFLNKEQEEVLIGSMLGDGCLYKHKNSKNPYFYISRKLEDLDYLNYQFEIFKSFSNYNDPKIFDILDKRTKKIYHQCKFVTRTCEVFKSYYEKWYNNVKILPIDLKLTPLICAIWFCDDGTISRSKTCNRIKLKLSTHCFTKDENIRLKNILSSTFNEYFGIVRDNGNFYITSADSGTKKFIKYIEKEIPKSMSRKIIWNENDFKQKRSLPHLNHRSDLDLNDKELSILKVLSQNNFLSTRVIAEKMNWILNRKVPTGLFCYLKKFEFKGFIERLILKNKSFYKISEKGSNLLNALITK